MFRSCGVMNVYANDESPQSANQDDYFVCDSQIFLREYLIGEKIPGTICNKLIKREIATALSFQRDWFMKMLIIIWFNQVG